MHSANVFEPLEESLLFNNTVSDEERQEIVQLYENNPVFGKFLVNATKEDFLIHDFSDNGSIVEVHRNVESTKSDYKDLLKVAGLLAQESQSIVQLTPRLHFKSKEYRTIYKDLLNTDYERKCPDIRIVTKHGNKIYKEYESFVRPVNKRKINNMLKDGLEQSSRIIIDVRDGISIRRVVGNLYGKIGKVRVDEVTLFDGHSLRRLYSKEHGFSQPYDAYVEALKTRKRD